MKTRCWTGFKPIRVICMVLVCTPKRIIVNIFTNFLSPIHSVFPDIYQTCLTDRLLHEPPISYKYCVFQFRHQHPFPLSSCLG